MRLITRKIHRAFPELDRFADEQCLRFVKAARSNRWYRVGAGLGLTGLLLAMLFGGLVGLSMLGGQADRLKNDWGFDPLAGFFGVVSIGILLLPALLVPLAARDLLLRLRVRYVLRHRANCLQCGYRLIGLQIHGANKVTCPECGCVSGVDPALGELIINSEGFTQLAQTDAAAGQLQAMYSPKFWRRFRRVAIALIVVFVVLPLSLWGAVYWINRAQSQAAAAAAITPKQLDAALQSLRPKTSNGRNAAEELRPILDLLIRVSASRDYVEDVTLADGTIKPVEPQIGVLLNSRGLGVATDPTAVSTQRRLTERLYADLERVHHLFDNVDAVTSADGVAWDAPASVPSLTMIFQDMPQMGGYIKLEALLRIRTRRAAGSGDAVAFASAIESRLLLARLLRSRGFRYEGALASAWANDAVVELVNTMRTEHSLLNGDTVDRLALAIRRQLPPFDPGPALEVSRLMALNDLSVAFANSATLRLWTPKDPADYYLNPNGTPTFRGPHWLGTFEQNRAALNAWFDATIDRVRKEPWQRSAASMAIDADLPIAASMVTNFIEPAARLAPGSGESIFDRFELNRRFAVLAIALARHRLTHGTYPATLDELSPLLPDRPRDPWSGKDFGYIPTSDSYTLYSVGPDGIDNQGQPIAGDAGPASAGDLVAGER
ncbi:MAG: hypothetical protein SFY96_04580 [Planctomycetota bacterium]|nr:hypothetical protein [Planctomycetota bacterium]